MGESLDSPTSNSPINTCVIASLLTRCSTTSQLLFFFHPRTLSYETDCVPCCGTRKSWNTTFANISQVEIISQEGVDTKPNPFGTSKCKHCKVMGSSLSHPVQVIVEFRNFNSRLLATANVILLAVRIFTNSQSVFACVPRPTHLAICPCSASSFVSSGRP